MGYDDVAEASIGLKIKISDLIPQLTSSDNIFFCDGANAFIQDKNDEWNNLLEQWIVHEYDSESENTENSDEGDDESEYEQKDESNNNDKFEHNEKNNKSSAKEIEINDNHTQINNEDTMIEIELNDKNSCEKGENNVSESNTIKKRDIEDEKNSTSYAQRLESEFKAIFLHELTTKRQKQDQSLWDQTILLPCKVLVETSRYGHQRYGDNGTSCDIFDITKIIEKINTKWKWLQHFQIVFIQKQTGR